MKKKKISEGEKEKKNTKKDGKSKKKSLTHKRSQEKKRLKFDRGDSPKNRENTLSTPILTVNPHTYKSVIMPSLITTQKYDVYI